MPHAQRLVNRHQQHALLKLLFITMFDTNDPRCLEGAQAASRIRRCPGGAAAAYLEVRSPMTCVWHFPISSGSCASAVAYKSCQQTTQASPARAARCCTACATPPCADLPQPHSVRALRHDDLNNVWCNAASCAGAALAVEPNLCEMRMQPEVRRGKAARQDARGKSLLAMVEAVLVIDVNMVNTVAVTYLQGTVPQVSQQR